MLALSLQQHELTAASIQQLLGQHVTTALEHMHNNKVITRTGDDIAFTAAGLEEVKEMQRLQELINHSASGNIPSDSSGDDGPFREQANLQSASFKLAAGSSSDDGPFREQAKWQSASFKLAAGSSSGEPTLGQSTRQVQNASSQHGFVKDIDAYLQDVLVDGSGDQLSETKFRLLMQQAGWKISGEELSNMITNVNKEPISLQEDMEQWSLDALTDERDSGAEFGA